MLKARSAVVGSAKSRPSATRLIVLNNAQIDRVADRLRADAGVEHRTRIKRSHFIGGEG